MSPFPPLVLAFCFLSLFACQQEEPTPSSQTSGLVIASQAYLDNFGEPPQGKQVKPLPASAIFPSAVHLVKCGLFRFSCSVRIGN